MNQSNDTTIKITYGKNHQARYIAHLDTIDIICKALRRLKLPYIVSQGCHIRPKITFGSPLPLGHASRCEQFIISLARPVDPDWLKNNLGDCLPAGMDVIKVEQPAPDETKGANGDLVTYLLGFSELETATRAMEFLNNPETSFSQLSKGKVKNYKIGNACQSIKCFEHLSPVLIEAEFVQGQAGLPSVSKIITALADSLAKKRDNLVKIERISLIKL
ncbi:MAG: TIGR03936 family radical SAM-associated protein [Candidatus Rifleibacteriota bacterium]